MVAWPTVPLGEVLTKSANWIPLDADTIYREVTVRLWGKGVAERRAVPGREIKSDQRLRVRANQFILSRIDARNGAFGLVPMELDGAVVSTDFPTFAVNESRLLSEFLNWLSKTEGFVDLCRHASEGTTNRVRLKEDAFLATPIALPTVAEQRRIVGRVDAVAGRLAEARRLRAEVEADCDSLLVAMAHRGDLDKIAKERAGWTRGTLGDGLRLVSDPVPVDRATGYPNLGIYSYARGLFGKPPIDGLASSANTLYRVRTGQFIYSRLFAFEGAYGLVPPEFDGRFVSNEYPTFEADPARLTTAFVAAYFKSPQVWKDVATGSVGIGHRRQRVHPEQLLTHQLWIPPLDWQRQIVDLQAKADTLRSLQAATAAELHALLPAVLADAFAGRL